MKTFTLYTEEIDFLDISIIELKEQYEKKLTKIGGLLKNTFGIIYADSETNFPLLMENISNAFSFPILAVSTMGLFCDCKTPTYSDTGIGMLVITGDDINASMAITDDIVFNDLEQKIDTAYQSLKEELGSEPKLILLYATQLLNYTPTQISKTLNSISGGIPAFGGIASDYMTFKDFTIAVNQEIRHHGVALLGLTGKGIEHAAVLNSIPTQTTKLFKGIITKANGKEIFEIDHIPVIQYLDQYSLLTDVDPNKAYVSCISTPFLITEKDDNGEDFHYVRYLNGYDRIQGYIMLQSDVNEGDIIQLCSMNEDTITESVRDIAQQAKKLISHTSYSYGTMLFLPCLGRFLIMNAVSQKKTIQNLKNEHITGQTLFGMYSCGEFCPNMLMAPKEEIRNYFHSGALSVLLL